MAPIDLLGRLINYYRKESFEKPPVIQPLVAAGLSIFYTLLYIIPFYLFEKTRPSPDLSRDAPTVITARIRTVTFSCVVTSFLTVFIAKHYAGFTSRETLQVLGWWPINVLDIVKTLALVAILFVGPLFEAAIIERRYRSWLRFRGISEVLSDSILFRNYIAGPVTEEIIFRSLIIPLHLFAKMSPTKVVFITPLYFGVAHIHHFYEFKLTHPQVPVVPALARTLFQFAYTSLFGFFASFLFLRTGSLPAAILAHSFCNLMGLPRFWGRLERHDAAQKNTLGGKFDREGKSGARLSIVWTVMYYLLLVAGAAGFYVNLWKLTDSPNALASFGKMK